MLVSSARSDTYKNMNKPADILKRAREQRGLTQRQVAAASGIDPKTIGNVEAGRTRPNGSTLLSIARALDFDTWSEVIAAYASTTRPSRHGDIPVLAGIPASWGFDGEVDSSFDHEEATEVLPEHFRVDDDMSLFGLVVTGDSMKPTYPEGAKVICSARHWHDHGFIDGFAYVIRFVEGDTTLKRIRDVEVGEAIDLVPDNPVHDTRRVLHDQVGTAALVRGVYTVEALPNLRG